MNIIEEFKKRGVFKQISNYEKFLNLPKNSGVYVGFDPTADSLHLGNYIQIINLLRFKKYGYEIIAVLGGATGMIGDPSFKEAERILLNEQQINHNKSKIKQQLEKFGFKVVDNYDFYKNMTIIDFLRDIGKLVNIAYIMSKDSIASRIEKGLSFTEFSYQLIQGWDFVQLYKDFNVKIQFGGSDQWGNITTGLDMISTLFGSQHQAIALTSQLLTDQNGNKFGKSTGGGNNWLAKEKTKPYDLYQFLLNQPDSQVEKLLKWLTFIQIQEIEDIMKKHFEQPSLKLAQKRLAYEVIKDIHSEQDAKNSLNISEILFNKNLDLNKFTLNDIKGIENELKTLAIPVNTNLVEFLIDNQILKSKREANEFIQFKSLRVNLQSITQEFLVNSEFFENQYAFLNVGKKQFYLIKIVK
ncbi:MULTISPECIES: tyrosine--tRNA ligase [unclassified Mycoplasma]|uniref:tyrosine--tRNA ligase n=1 Tax=unclassified Mycoplasma TaxID=2683645 RepID=UPI00211B7A16|nr:MULTISPECIES: tyrosine--tRNA ligase [unclassified Mycoplasma]UUM19991.1 tyrosine--tRNA ligase [Mycoplasma sp. 1578d]UUM24972.1 tyrosine--tRNA ligase [Mycoplasma sp. 3686d]